jgi:hypothetical protein
LRNNRRQRVRLRMMAFDHQTNRAYGLLSHRVSRTITPMIRRQRAFWFTASGIGCYIKPSLGGFAKYRINGLGCFTR